MIPTIALFDKDGNRSLVNRGEQEAEFRKRGFRDEPPKKAPPQGTAPQGNSNSGQAAEGK